jgi:hypothetical protein
MGTEEIITITGQDMAITKGETAITLFACSEARQQHKNLALPTRFKINKTINNN